MNSLKNQKNNKNIFLITIDYVLKEMNKRRELKAQIEEHIDDNKSYLQSGIYKLIRSDSGKIITYKSNEKSKKFINKLVDVGYESTTLIKQIKAKVRGGTIALIEYRNIVFKNGLKFKGTIMMVTYNNDVKIFDLESNQVINVVKDKDKYFNFKETHYKFSKYFTTPTISYVPEEQIYFEKYLDYKPYKLWSPTEKSKAVQKIFSNYKNYFMDYDNKKDANEVSVNVFLKNLESKVNNKELLNIIYDLIPKQYHEDKWILIKCHGDVVFSNILLYEDEYYFIDWIDSGKFIFYYDLLNFMFGEAAFHNNYSYIKNYLRGVYDQQFSSIFETFNLQYCENKRSYYLALFLVERINFRLKSKNDNNLLSVLNNYHKTLLNIEKLL